MSKRPPNHPDRFAPNTPEWMRNSTLSTRLVNVLMAAGYDNEGTLRLMAQSDSEFSKFARLVNMGKKGMGELRDWAGILPIPRRDLKALSTPLSAEMAREILRLLGPMSLHANAARAIIVFNFLHKAASDE